MRLCRPSFAGDAGVYSEAGDALHGALAPSAGDGRGMGTAMELPPNFGAIYLGQTFSSYISAHNHSVKNVSEVGIKAELQTQTRRITLLDTTPTPEAVLSSGDNRDFIVEQELRERGVHILVCSAVYTNSEGESKYFRQFFKFQVLNPFVIVKHVRALKDVIYLQVSLRNDCATPVFVEVMRFRETPLFTRVDVGSEEEGTFLHGRRGEQKPGDMQQFLYKLVPRKIQGLNERIVIGQVEVVWRGLMGESGHIQQAVEFRPKEKSEAAQTADAEALVSDSTATALGREVSVTLEGVPERIVAGTSFELTCRVSNRAGAARSMSLQWNRELPLNAEGTGSARARTMSVAHAALLDGYAPPAPPPVPGMPPPEDWEADQLSDSRGRILGAAPLMRSEALRAPGIVWQGSCPLPVGELAACSSKSVTLRLFASRPGIHRLSGLSVLDTSSGLQFQIGDMPQVFVRSQADAAAPVVEQSEFDI